MVGFMLAVLAQWKPHNSRIMMLAQWKPLNSRILMFEAILSPICYHMG